MIVSLIDSFELQNPGIYRLEYFQEEQKVFFTEQHITSCTRAPVY
jgi:hypothetical protein